MTLINLHVFSLMFTDFLLFGQSHSQQVNTDCWNLPVSAPRCSLVLEGQRKQRHETPVVLCNYCCLSSTHVIYQDQVCVWDMWPEHISGRCCFTPCVYWRCISEPSLCCEMTLTHGIVPRRFPLVINKNIERIREWPSTSRNSFRVFIGTFLCLCGCSRHVYICIPEASDDVVTGNFTQWQSLVNLQSTHWVRPAVGWF